MGFLLLWREGDYETLGGSSVCYMVPAWEPGRAAALVAQSHSEKPPLQQDSPEAKHLGEREGDDWHCYLHSLPARLTVGFVPHMPKATPSRYLQPQLAICQFYANVIRTLQLEKRKKFCLLATFAFLTALSQIQCLWFLWFRQKSCCEHLCCVHNHSGLSV